MQWKQSGQFFKKAIKINALYLIINLFVNSQSKMSWWENIRQCLRMKNSLSLGKYYVKWIYSTIITKILRANFFDRAKNSWIQFLFTLFEAIKFVKPNIELFYSRAKKFVKSNSAFYEAEKFVQLNSTLNCQS